MTKRLFLFAFLCILVSTETYSLPIFLARHYLSSTKKYAPVITPGGPVNFCQGSFVELKTTENGDSFQWYKDGNALTDETNKTYKAETSGSYSLKVTTAGTAVESNVVVVTVYQLPTSSFTTNATGSNCSNEEISFTNTSTGSDLTYSWDFGDPNSGSANTSTEQHPKHVFVGTAGSGTQTFSVKLTVKNGGCTVTSVPMNVITKQVPDGKLAGTGSIIYEGLPYFKVCANNSALFNFSNQSTTITTNASYKIEWGDGSTDYISTTFGAPISHTYQIGLHTLTYTIIGSNGCQTISKYYVFVGSNPAVGLGNPGNTTICTGGILRFPLTGTENNPPGTVYTITFNDGTPPIKLVHPLVDKFIDHEFKKSSCGTISSNSGVAYPNSFSASVIASNPCNVSAASVVPIYVSEKPEALFSVIPNSTPKPMICVNNVMTFTNTSKGNVVTAAGCEKGKFVWVITPSSGWSISSGTLGNDFSLNDPGVWTSGSEMLRINFATAGNYVVSLKIGTNAIDDLNGCGPSSVAKTICVNPTPTAKFVLDQTEGCAPFNVKATNQSNIPLCGTNTYQWTVTYSASSCTPASSQAVYVGGTSSISEHPQFRFDNAGIYNINLVTKNSDESCTSTTYTQQIIVKQKPVVNLSSILPICEGATINPTATVQNCNSSTTESYVWEFPGSTTATSTAKAPTGIIYPAAGIYTIKLTVTNDCGPTTVTQNITVNAAPVVVPIADKIVCRGESIPAITFATSPVSTGVTYTWTNNNSSIGLSAGNTSNTIPAFTAANSTNTIQTATITVTPKTGSCTGIPITFKISVNPSAPTAVAGNDQNLCDVTSTVLNGNNPGSAFTGKWSQTAGSTAGITFDDDSKYNATVTGLAVGQSYEFKWTINGIGTCPPTGDLVKITVSPKTAGGTTAGTQTFCGPSTAGSITLSGYVGDILRWESSPNGSSWSTVPSTVGLATYNYPVRTATTQYRAVVQSGNCAVENSTVSVITINTIPAKPTTVTSVIYCLNDAATALTATGSGLKWYTSLPSGTNFNTVAATPVTSAAGTTTYYVTQTVNGCESLPETIVVKVNPLITNNTIGADQTICTASIPTQISQSGAAISGGTNSYTYLWEQSSDGTNWTILSGVLTANYQPGSLSADQYYRRKVTSGTCTSTSNVVKISVQGSLTNVQISASQTICSGTQPEKLTGEIPAGGNGSFVYSWEHSTSSASSGFTVITGETGTDYQPPVLTQTTYFRRTTTGGSCSSISTPATITVNPIPVMQPVSDVTVCNAAMVSAIVFQSILTSSNISYKWVNDNTAIGLGASGSGNLPGFTSNNTTKSPAVANITVTPTYTQNGKACDGTPLTFKIIILPTVAVSAIADLTVCAGSQVSAFIFSNDADVFAGSTVTYSWTVNGGNIGLTAGSGHQIPSFTAINNTAITATANITVTPTYNFSGKNCSGTPVAFKINVNAAPKVNFSIPDQVLCNKAASSEVLLSSVTPGTTFSWSAQPVAGLTGLILSGTDKIPVQTLINNTNSPLTVVYTAVASTSGSAQCPGSAATYQITVNPTPNVSASTISKIICANTEPSISLSSTVWGTVFNWVVSANANITGASNGSGNLIDQVLVNTSSEAQNITYTVTPRFAGNSASCNGTPLVITITVNPSPKVQFSGSDMSVCSGGTTPQINLSSTSLGAKITWTSNIPAGITGATTQTGTTTIPAETLTNSGNVPLTIVYTATATTDDANACIGSSFTYKVTVNPVAKITNVVLKQEICSGSGSSLVALTSNVSGTTFKWTASSSADVSGYMASGAGNIPSQNIINSGVNPALVKYIITPEANGCTGTPGVYEIVVNPKPIFTGIAAPAAICSNTLFSYLPGSSTAGVTFTWKRAAVSGISNPAATGSGVDQAGGISETLINTTVNPIDVTYQYTLSIGDCISSTSYPVVVRVNPAPTALFGPFRQNGCAPFAISVKNLNSKTFANIYTVDFGDGSPVEVYTDERDINHVYQNETSLPKTFNLQIKTKNDCGEAASITYLIVVQPQSVFSKLVLQGNQRYGCAPFTIDFTTLNQSTGANVYTWDFGDGSPLRETHQLNEPLVHTYVNAGDYKVTLTATNGCSTVTSEQTITVYPNVTASFTTDKPQYCLSETVKFSNTSDSQFTAFWDFGDGTTSTAINPAHHYTTAGIKTIILKATKNYPDGSSCTVSTTQTVQITPGPIASFNSNAGNLNCGPFKLIVTSTPANAVNVEWDFGDPSGVDNIATGYNASHTYHTPGTYLITAKAYSLQGCTAITTQTIKITETPKPAFSYPDNLICGSNATIQFKNETTYSGTDVVSYKWYVNEVLSGSAKDLVYTFNTPTSVILPYVYRIKLEATNIVGCTNSIEHTVQFNPLPQANFTVDATKACAPFTPKIVNTSLFSDKFEWYLDGVLVSRDRNPTDIVFNDPEKTYSLKLIADNQYGCGSNSNTKQLSTYPIPKASFNLTNNVSCNGVLDVEITNTSAGATSFTWDYGDGTPVYVGSSPKHIYGKAGIYELKLTASNGFCTNIYSQTVKIADAPKAAFLADVKTGCNQLTVTFQDLSVNATDYLWDFGDGSFSTQKNPVHTYNFVKSPFTVKLTAKGNFGCSDEWVMLNYISVFAPPTAAIIISPSRTIKVPDYSFDFNVKTEDNITGYKWDFGDGKTADKANINHTYSDVGTYKIKLTLTNSSGCVSLLEDEVNVIGVPGYFYLPNAFEPANAKPDLKVFKVTATGMSSYTLRVFNKWGQTVWQSNKLNADGVPTEYWDGTMNGQPAPQGAYYWTAEASFINGTTWKGMKYEGRATSKTGVVHLIR